MTDPNASITTPMSTEEWTTNPFMWTTNSFTRNFNPSTTTGNKTFIEKTKSPADGSRIGDILTFTRLPDGTLNKHKARLCAHGGMQQWGVNYWESYAPVVNWVSVHSFSLWLSWQVLRRRHLSLCLLFLRKILTLLYTWNSRLVCHMTGSIKIGNMCYLFCLVRILLSRPSGCSLILFLRKATDRHVPSPFQDFYYYFVLFRATSIEEVS